jgi:hypothetical protein
MAYIEFVEFVGIIYRYPIPRHYQYISVDVQAMGHFTFTCLAGP